MEEALFRSLLSNSVSTKMFGPLEASQSSLMLGFLLVCNRCLLDKAILAALCAKLGMPNPQWFMGELTHSVTQALGGSSSHSLMWLVHSLSIMFDRKASVNLYIFSSKLN